MNEISESELSRVSAQAGITYVIGDSGLRITQDSFRISDTDSDPLNWIEFNNITVDDGNGGYFSMDTPVDFEHYNKIDLMTDDDGQTFVWMNLSTGVQPRTYTVGNLVFCNQDLGSIRLENLRRGASDRLMIGGRTTGCGIDLEYDTELTIDALKYSYNGSGQFLALSGIHLAGSAGGTPEDPATWTYAGKFRIGDLENANPATIDVGTSTVDETTSIFYNLPMAGSLRVENVRFDTSASGFGPCAIDGINVHRLGVRMGTN